jgi:hypothetical protein
MHRAAVSHGTITCPPSPPNARVDRPSPRPAHPPLSVERCSSGSQQAQKMIHQFMHDFQERYQRCAVRCQDLARVSCSVWCAVLCCEVCLHSHMRPAQAGGRRQHPSPARLVLCGKRSLRVHAGARAHAPPPVAQDGLSYGGSSNELDQQKAQRKMMGCLDECGNECLGRIPNLKSDIVSELKRI